MKKLVFLMALSLLIQMGRSYAGVFIPPSSGSGGSAVALGFLSAVGIDPLGLGIGGGTSSTTAPAANSQSSIKTQFTTLASLSGSYDLLNQSAGSSLNTLDILK